jgi:hypothetical protein
MCNLAEIIVRADRIGLVAWFCVCSRFMQASVCAFSRPDIDGVDSQA